MTANEQKLRKGWKQEIEFRHSEREQAQRDLDTLRVENARLREALQDVTQYAQAMIEARVDAPEYVNWRGIQDLARAALA